MLKASTHTTLKVSLVEVVPYNPQWPALFAQEAAKIQVALGQNCVTVHHIGSTSVPGMSAKPILDMVPAVKDILKVDTARLEHLGYEGRGEMGMLFRRYFSNHVCHVHIWEEGNPEIDRHLIFRDYLTKNPDEAQRYEALKLRLAAVFPKDRTSYTLSKDGLIKDMLQKAGFEGITMVQALLDQEWEAAKGFRQRYFFDLHGIQDPYTWTFEDPNHFHIVLMKGRHIIGYAHLQFWPHSRAALRLIVVDEAYRSQGIGRQFLGQIERWLTHQGITSLHRQSSPETLAFYKQAGYTEMPFSDPDGHKADPRDIDMGKVLAVIF